MPNLVWKLAEPPHFPPLCIRNPGGVRVALGGCTDSKASGQQESQFLCGDQMMICLKSSCNHEGKKQPVSCKQGPAYIGEQSVCQKKVQLLESLVQRVRGLRFLRTYGVKFLAQTIACRMGQAGMLTIHAKYT
jgi:hypothetical protein